MYSMELENIEERTAVGRQVYLQKGGVLGKPMGSCETEGAFFKKGVELKCFKVLEKRINCT